MSVNIEEAVRAEEEKSEKKIDFKMITFSLMGRYYGIDIMKIKEISKIHKFTYVPNTFPYVRGVHNLRGEIISVIDFRKMFNLDVETEDNKENTTGIENVLILKLKEYKIGVIVDKIDKVIGISKETIQPPPALFSDINIKYLNGVVEYKDNLYIILDVDLIFCEQEDTVLYKQPAEREKVIFQKEKKTEAQTPDLSFMVEALAAFNKYYVSSLNEEWVKNRLIEWKAQCESQGRTFQLESAVDAEKYLSTFYSPYTGMLWPEKYRDNIISLLPDNLSGSITIWNPGCGKGYETYSIACIVKLKYPDARIKVWANDNSLMEVSNAPDIVIAEKDIPQYILKNEFVKKIPNKGYSFSKGIMDSIYFEYHDILNENTIPPVNVIIARDVLSFFNTANQDIILNEFKEKLVTGGVLVIGQNEKITLKEWKQIRAENIIVYQKVEK